MVDILESREAVTAVECDPVAALRARAGERLLDAGKEAIEVEVVTGAHGGDADADAYRHHGLADRHLAQGDPMLERVGEDRRPGLVGVWQSRQEPVAPGAAERVRLADPEANPERHLAKDAVAPGDAVGGVDLAEAIDVEQH